MAQCSDTPAVASLRLGDRRPLFVPRNPAANSAELIFQPPFTTPPVVGMMACCGLGDPQLRWIDEERSAMAEDRIPMTREGYDKLKAELDRFRSVEMIEITKRVATAREMGDLSENAEYHAAREDQGILQARINDLSDRIARAVIVDPTNLPKDTVVFGSKVRVMDLDIDEEETFELVGPGQENPDKGRILSTSPIGQGLIGRKKGETVKIEVPRGTIRFKVLEISAANI
jgi:transcription elongation factor GreA